MTLPMILLREMLVMLEHCCWSDVEHRVGVVEAATTTYNTEDELDNEADLFQKQSKLLHALQLHMVNTLLRVNIYPHLSIVGTDH